MHVEYRSSNLALYKRSKLAISRKQVTAVSEKREDPELYTQNYNSLNKAGSEKDIKKKRKI